MEKLKIFKKEELFNGEIRSLLVDDKPYFVANDIAKTLGYKVPKDAISKYCKGALKYSLLTNGGKQEMKIIPEGDIYRLIMKSKLPKAQEFESWVCDEVLPTIRKTGGYIDNVDKLLETTFKDVEFKDGLSLEEMLREVKNKQDTDLAILDTKLKQEQAKVEVRSMVVTRQVREIQAYREQLEEEIAYTMELDDKLEEVYDKYEFANSKVKQLRNGEDVLLTVGDLVKILNVQYLTTTCFHEWLCSKRFGEMVLNTSGKSRYFSPSEKFIKHVANKGHAWTSTRNGKVEIRYRESFADIIKKREIDNLTRFAKEYRFMAFK